MTCPRMRIFGTVSVVRQIWTVVHSRSGIALIWSTNRLSACRSNGKFIQQPPDAEMFLRIFLYDLHLFVDIFSSRGLSSASCAMACVSVRTIERWIVVFLSVAEASALDYFRSDGNGSVDQLFAFAEQIHLLPSLSAKSARIAALLLFVTRVPPKRGKRANHKLHRWIRPLYNETFHVNRSRIIPRRLTSVFSFSMADTGSSDPLWYLNQCFQRVEQGELADVEMIFTFIQPPVDKIPLFRLEKTVGFKKMAKNGIFACHLDSSYYSE